MINPILKIFEFFTMNLMIRRAKGRDNIPANSNFILVANHERYGDPWCICFTVLNHINKQIHFVASPKFWPYLGKGICEDFWGCIPAYPGKTYNRVKDQLLKGNIVGLFPEGYLHIKGKAPSDGAVRLALETKIPILPVAVKSSYMPLKSEVIFGKPFLITDKKNTKKQMSTIMKDIYELKGDLDAK